MAIFPSRDLLMTRSFVFFRGFHIRWHRAPPYVKTADQAKTHRSIRNPATVLLDSRSQTPELTSADRTRGISMATEATLNQNRAQRMLTQTRSNSRGVLPFQSGEMRPVPRPEVAAGGSRRRRENSMLRRAIYAGRRTCEYTQSTARTYHCVSAYGGIPRYFLTASPPAL